MSTPEARLLGPWRRPRPRGVALLLPGGDEASRRSLPSWDVSVVRMRMFAGPIETLSRGHVAALTLKYRLVGWNDPDEDPVIDARAALDRISARWPGVPVVLVGHSLGGRVALRVADHPAVVGVCGLAPWVTETEDPAVVLGRSLLVLHSPKDFATDAGDSEEFVRRVQALGGLDAQWRAVRFDSHPMLLRAVEWHTAAARFVLRCVTGAGGPGRVTARP